ncbi:unnamed protein product [Polarella glacialis]|uniref:Uncharacterized protein n=1 Tax=Polarella glacialis TaxID=89957 RepID=A0A813K5V5_POLGL|nr:unnamed protein product [Polarella glacialis]
MDPVVVEVNREAIMKRSQNRGQLGDIFDNHVLRQLVVGEATARIAKDLVHKSSLMFLCRMALIMAFFTGCTIFLFTSICLLIAFVSIFMTASSRSRCNWGHLTSAGRPEGKPTKGSVALSGTECAGNAPMTRH